MWEDFYKRGIMALGWDELGDLKSYESKEDILARLQEVHNSDSKFFNSVHAVWQFSREMKPGDVVFVKRGMSEILGRGVVVGEYEYDSADNEYPHLRKMKWTHEGVWSWDEKLAMKTLTEITDLTEKVAKLSALFGDEEDEVDGESLVPELAAYTQEGAEEGAA